MKTFRSKRIIKLARKHLAEWAAYCHRRGSAHAHRHQLSPALIKRMGVEGREARDPWFEFFICTGCAYDAIAAAIEEAEAKNKRRK